MKEKKSKKSGCAIIVGFFVLAVIIGGLLPEKGPEGEPAYAGVTTAAETVDEEKFNKDEWVHKDPEGTYAVSVSTAPETTAVPTTVTTTILTTVATTVPTTVTTTPPTTVKTTAPTVVTTTTPTTMTTAAPTTVAPAVTEAPTTVTEQKPQEQSGMLYVLNTNTKKFHYPDCSSVDKIKPENYLELRTTRDEIIGMGYEPCKRCCP